MSNVRNEARLLLATMRVKLGSSKVYSEKKIIGSH